MITFFVRTYVTEDNAGDSYDMNFTAININRFWSDSDYYPGITSAELYADGLTVMAIMFGLELM